jgi:outer membrane protein assembly factor BamB
MSRLLVLGACLAVTFPASADNWPQWRGPKNDGISAEKGLPTEWSESKNLLWKVPMPGMGSSTPCVWGNKIFLTSADASDNLLALCVSTVGKELWRKVLGKSDQRGRGAEGNGASASPSTDGKHVWFCVGSGDLACFDLDGNEVWHLKVQDRYGDFLYDYGWHSTPVLNDGRLYIQLMNKLGQHVISLEAATGKEVWKIKRPSDGRAECLHVYASPFMWTSGTDSLLIVHGNDYTTAHDLKDGHEVWRVGDLNGKETKYNPTFRFVASPVCTPDLIVIPTAKSGPVVAVNPRAKGQVMAESEFTVWRKKAGTPDVPCPLVHDGLLYLVRESGMLQTWDAKTGEEKYPAQRLHNNKHRASPVLADGKLYAVARDGVTTVIKAGPKFELLSENRLPDDIAASPAIADGRIYLRGFKNLYAFGNK